MHTTVEHQSPDCIDLSFAICFLLHSIIGQMDDWCCCCWCMYMYSLNVSVSLARVVRVYRCAYENARSNFYISNCFWVYFRVLFVLIIFFKETSGVFHAYTYSYIRASLKLIFYSMVLMCGIKGCVCVRVLVCVCVCVCIYVYICVYLWVHAQRHKHTRVHTHTHTHTLYIYIYIYIYMCVCVCANLPSFLLRCGIWMGHLMRLEFTRLGLLV